MIITQHENGVEVREEGRDGVMEASNWGTKESAECRFDILRKQVLMYL
jgi:hypothetical protein